MTKTEGRIVADVITASIYTAIGLGCICTEAGVISAIILGVIGIAILLERCDF